MTSPVHPGDVLLGKYRVERILGQGGMGVVVAARHIELGELFAIKFMLPAALAQPDAVERFLREARASARLKSEHVVKVQDVGRLSEGLPYMVMEHLSGSDLRDVVRERGPLPVAEALTYVLQACEALAEAHSLGIVHRDLKPANMFLIRRPDGSPYVKVLDFGISKQMMPENAEHQVLTRTGMVLGSPIYMAPEQMIRAKEADPRSDIWSMGVVLYQLLTGTVPFLADVLTELVAKILQDEPLPPTHHRPDIPPSVDAIVMTCLQKPREQRFQTVQQFIYALQGVLPANASPPRDATPLLPPTPLAAASLSLVEPGIAACAEPPARLEGNWIGVENSNTYFLRMIDGNLRGCYTYAGEDSLIGELYQPILTDSAMFARFRWMDNSIHGYMYAHLNTVDEVIGGWWYDYDVPERIRLDISLLSSALPRMNPHRWIRRKSARAPRSVELFFSECQWTI